MSTYAAKDMYENAHGGIHHNSPHLETLQMPMPGRENEAMVRPSQGTTTARGGMKDDQQRHDESHTAGAKGQKPAARE